MVVYAFVRKLDVFDRAEIYKYCSARIFLFEN